MMLNKKFNRRPNLKIMALLPLAGFLFTVVAIINALIPEDLTAAPAKPLNVLGFNQSSKQFNSLGRDTSKTKTIKIVHKQNRPDSIITETYEVKVIGDTARGKKIVHYNNRKMEGDTSNVVYIIEEQLPEEILMEDPDSLHDVLVKTNVMYKEKVVITKNVITPDNSTSEELSNTLIIIDGVEHKEKNAISSISPDLIEKVDVIKDKQMMKKYTNKDYEGVIIITTKAKKK